MLDIKTVKLRSEEQIIASWNDKETIIVTVACVTYNHERYIEDAIMGFLMQETDFAFEVIIHDDASTDSTPEIVERYQRSYPNIIKPVYQTINQYSKHPIISPKFIFPISKGNYIAMCEGDDYWTNSQKLQKQVSFMASNEELSMVFHQAKMESHHEMGGSDEYTKSFGETGILNLTGLFFEGGSSAPTASILFKRKLIDIVPKFLLISPVGDMPLKLICSTNGKIGYINEVMSVRRIGVPGSWNIRTRLNKEKQTNYLNGMILMLETFDKYSDGKWSIEIDKKCVSYARQINRIGTLSKINIKKRFVNYYKSLSLKEKFFFHLRNLKINFIRVKDNCNVFK